jgi:hypothetical protein
MMTTTILFRLGKCKLHTKSTYPVIQNSVNKNTSEFKVIILPWNFRLKLFKENEVQMRKVITDIKTVMDKVELGKTNLFYFIFILFL